MSLTGQTFSLACVETMKSWKKEMRGGFHMHNFSDLPWGAPGCESAAKGW